MKKLRQISLHQLDGAELEKRQEGLLFGGGTPGECRCGSCSSSGGTPSTESNRDANSSSGYTGSGSNPAQCTCHGEASGTNIACTKPAF